MQRGLATIPVEVDMPGSRPCCSGRIPPRYDTPFLIHITAKKGICVAKLLEGDEAPDFSLPRGAGGTLHLADLQGKVVILYFYPKDDTEACTAEAMDFSAARKDFEAAGAMIVGVSPDPAKRHARFVSKYGLSIELLSDEELRAANAYGVWVEKSMYGRTFMGVERATYLIDRRGRIARIWRKVRVKGHVAEVLEAARTLVP